MTTRRPRWFGIEKLEAREMLSGVVASVHASSVAKGAMTPYQELTLKGHFVTGVPTTVTFAAKHGAAITVTPASVTKTTVVVAVPAFFDSKTDKPIAESASVSVHQTVGGHVKNVQVIKSLSIAQLPQTGLMAGDVIGAVTVAAASVTSFSAAEYTQISQNAANTPTVRLLAAEITADLGEISVLIPLAQQQLVSLAFGAVSSVPLGTYQGQTATLDTNQLGLLDRIIAGGVEGAIGGTATTGVGLVATLDGLVAGALLDGPSVVVARAKNVIDVQSTALGSPVIPSGAVVTGLAIGSLSAVVAAAEAEAQLILGANNPITHSGPPNLALIDQVLDDPALGQSLNAITSGLVPSTPAGLALIQAAQLAESLAALIDPNVPSSLGAQFAS